jgi:hypothetical protein
VSLDRGLERKAEVKLSEEKNEEWERRKAFLMGKRFNGVPICNIKSHFVTIDSGVLYGIMREISPEFIVRKTEFTGDTQGTHWKNNFDFKLLKVSKQELFTGMIETDGVAMCVLYPRLKRDRPGPSSANHEEYKEEDPATQKVQDNDHVVGTDPTHTNIIRIAAPKRSEDGTDGSLRQKDMRLLRFPRTR